MFGWIIESLAFFPFSNMNLMKIILSRIQTMVIYTNVYVNDLTYVLLYSHFHPGMLFNIASPVPFLHL